MTFVTSRARIARRLPQRAGEHIEPMEADERHATIDGIRSRWLERGEGPAVVLVHGIPTSPALWRHVLPLIDGARLLAWEMVGYGRSWDVAPGVDISVKAQAGHLHRWLDELGIERALLVGHDLGGGVCQIAAVDQPDRCAGLVLTNSIGYDSWPIPMVRALQRVRGGTAQLTPRLFKPLLAGFLRPGHDDRARARESFEAHWPGYAHRRGPAAFARQVRSLRTEDTLEVADRLPRLDARAAVVWGAADQFQTIEYGRRLAGDLGARITEIPGGRHFVPEDHPHDVAAAVTAVVAAAG
jgi:pimeloyl-ACP methyl ester carboxylesterase